MAACEDGDKGGMGFGLRLQYASCEGGVGHVEEAEEEELLVALLVAADPAVVGVVATMLKGANARHSSNKRAVVTPTSARDIAVIMMVDKGWLCRRCCVILGSPP